MNDLTISSSDALRAALEANEAKGQVTEDKLPPADGETPPASRPEGEGTLGKDNETPQLAPETLETLTVEQLLGNEKLGGELKSWADKQFAAQLEGKTESLRQAVRDELTPTLTEEITQQLNSQAVGKFLEGLESDDRVKELLQDNPEINKLFESYKANGIPTSDLAGQESIISRRATVHAYLTQIKGLNSLIAENNLPAEVTDKLKPELAEKYPNSGDEAMQEWTKAVYSEIINHRAQKLQEEQWEAFKEERLAEEEGKAPGGGLLNRGTRQEPKRDITQGSSREHLAAALAKTTK